MRKHLRLFCMLLTLSICAGMTFACDKKDEDKPAPAATELTIGSDFVIVSPAAPSDSEREAANTVSAALGRLGVSVVTADDSTAKAKNEILIGKTSRTPSQDALNGLADGDFTVRLTGDADNGYQIVLAANSDDGIELAARYFVSTYLSGENPGKLPISLAHTYKRADTKIAGKPISGYTVVYAKEGVGGDSQIEAAKYADTVVEFVDLIEKATGTRLNTVPDTTRIPDSTPVILFGNTAHEDDNSAYSRRFKSVGSYTADILENGNIVLAGGNPCAALAAGEALVDTILGTDEELSAMEISGTKDLIRVACVGDSITYGTNSTDPSMQSYPVYLQRMLGYDYYVEKYGAPSHSLIETDTQSFLKHDYFRLSRATDPDVVIVMLGTNDCRTQKWEDSAYKDWNDPARKEAFLASGQKLIDAYRKANSDVQIIFSTCPTVPQDAWLGTDWTMRIRRYGNPAISELARTNGCPVIDIFSYSEDHPEMFEGGDGLHPQNQQYEILAEGIYGLVKDIIKKP